MASEYLKWKYRDVRPDETRPLTPAEKRRNWWDYHKWQVLIGAALLVLLADLGWTMAGRGEAKADYQIAYVGTNALPEDTAAAIESAFAALGEDLNGDGQVIVRLVQYASTGGTDAGVAYSAQVSLMGDILDCESGIFLLEDPAEFQREHHVLCRLDGSLPPESDYSTENLCISWSRCPVLAGQTLGDYAYPLLGGTVSGSSDDLTAPLYLARRGYWTEKTAPYPEGDRALWDKLTEGAMG